MNIGAFVCLLDFANDNLDKPAIILHQSSQVHMMREGELGRLLQPGRQPAAASGIASGNASGNAGGIDCRWD